MLHCFVHAVRVRSPGAGQTVEQALGPEGLIIAPDLVELLPRIPHDFYRISLRCRVRRPALANSIFLHASFTFVVMSHLLAVVDEVSQLHRYLSQGRHDHFRFRPKCQV